MFLKGHPKWCSSDTGEDAQGALTTMLKWHWKWYSNETGDDTQVKHEMIIKWNSKRYSCDAGNDTLISIFTTVPAIIKNYVAGINNRLYIWIKRSNSVLPSTQIEEVPRKHFHYPLHQTLHSLDKRTRQKIQTSDSVYLEILLTRIKAFSNTRKNYL